MTAAQRVDLWLRQATPIALTILLAVLSAVPIGIPGYAAVVPAYTAMAAFYWAVFRPDLQPPFALFLVGVLQDILAATPLGMTALALMIVHGLAVSQRRAFLGKPFVLAWFGFVLIYALAGFLVWVLASLLALQLVGPEPAVFQYLVTVTLFPVVAWVFVRIHRYVVR
jgi:rod shape-determining protein MreD